MLPADNGLGAGAVRPPRDFGLLRDAGQSEPPQEEVEGPHRPQGHPGPKTQATDFGQIPAVPKDPAMPRPTEREIAEAAAAREAKEDEKDLEK
jgi:hypothetical protein